MRNVLGNCRENKEAEVVESEKMAEARTRTKKEKRMMMMRRKEGYERSLYPELEMITHVGSKRLSKYSIVLCNDTTSH